MHRSEKVGYSSRGAHGRSYGRVVRHVLRPAYVYPPELRRRPASRPGSCLLFPESTQVAAGSQLSFSGTGGTPPYTYTVEAGPGTIHLTTGVYTAPPSSRDATIQVEDHDSQTAATTVVVTPGPLVLTPTYVASVQTNEHVLFHASGGRILYVYSILSGVGIINSSNGDYSSAVARGIRSRSSGRYRWIREDGDDRRGGQSPHPPLTISPSTLTVEKDSLYQFTLEGGEPPYNWQVTQGTAAPGRRHVESIHHHVHDRRNGEDHRR